VQSATSTSLRLYHCPQARSFRPLWTLEELSLPYELVVLPFPPRVRAREYLAINPLGTVPAFFDGDLSMTESVAICEYLAARYGPTPLALDVADPEYGCYLNWLHFGEATLTTALAIVLRYGQLEPLDRRVPQVVEDYTRWFYGRFRAVEAALKERKYLCCGRFTLADISVGFALMTADNLGLRERMAPEIGAYRTRLVERPAHRRAVQAGRRAEASGGVIAVRPELSRAALRP
jgi:glutathione S-transferase